MSMLRGSELTPMRLLRLCLVAAIATTCNAWLNTGAAMRRLGRSHTQLAAAPPPFFLEGAPTIDIWDTSTRVEGDSLRTWDMGETSTERVQVSLRSPGRPIHSSIELWHTPSYVPMKFSYYAEHGGEQHFHAVIETPKSGNTIAVFNTEGQEPVTPKLEGIFPSTMIN